MRAERDLSDSNAYIIGFGLSLSGRRQAVINNEDFVKIVEKVKTQKRIENMEGNQDLPALESGGGLNQVAGSGFLKCI